MQSICKNRILETLFYFYIVIFNSTYLGKAVCNIYNYPFSLMTMQIW